MYPSQRPVSSPQSIFTQNTKNPDHLYDANRNHVVPYYYSETLPSMPNNVYSVPNTYLTNKNRHTVANYPYDQRQIYYQRKSNPKVKSTLNASPDTTQIFSKSNTYQGPQIFRPYSVLETTSKSQITSIPRPSSVVPMTEQYRPASFFQTDNDTKTTNEIPEWKARLQKDMPFPFKGLEKPLKPICRIPNCKCSVKPVEYMRASEIRTLPTVSERSLNKLRNLSLPTLKLEDLERDEKSDRIEPERDPISSISKPISEQHLGYV